MSKSTKSKSSNSVSSLTRS